MTKPMTAEDLLAHFAELIQQFNSPPELDVMDDQAADDSTDTAATATGLTADQQTPWADLTGIEETNLLYKMPPEVVAKMDWVMDNVPRMNKQRIVRDTVGAFLDGLIEKHYKPN